MHTFPWTVKQERAAELLADGVLTDQQIADLLGLSRAGLARWKRRPEFLARIQEHVDAQRAALKAEGIALRQNRLDALNDRWQRMQNVIEARAHDATLTDPAAPTGLLVRTYKQIGTGRLAQMVEEYAVDTGLLRELREHEKQAAQELGQWTEKRDVTSDGQPIPLVVIHSAPAERS